MSECLELNKELMEEWCNKLKQKNKDPRAVLMLNLCCSYSLADKIIAGRKVPNKSIRKLMALTMKKPIGQIWLQKSEGFASNSPSQESCQGEEAA